MHDQHIGFQTHGSQNRLVGAVNAVPTAPIYSNPDADFQKVSTGQARAEANLVGPVQSSQECH